MGWDSNNSTEGGLDVVVQISIWSSLVCLLLVLFTFLRYRSFRRHPSPLVFGRALYDAVFLVTLLWGEQFSDKTPDFCSETPKGRFQSYLTEFSAVGSELWVLSMSIDLMVSFRSPFADFKKHRRYAWILALLGSAAPAAVLVLSPGTSGFNEILQLCWVVGNDQRGQFNWRTWVFFFMPTIMIYIAGFFSLGIACNRASQLVTPTSSFHTRRLVLRGLGFLVLIFTGYWLICAAVYLWSFSSGPANTSVLAGVLRILLGLRGWVTGIVWFCSADLKAERKRAARALTSGGAGGGSGVALRTGSKGQGVDDDLSPILNAALRKEMVYYSSCGMRLAARHVVENEADLRAERVVEVWHVLPRMRKVTKAVTQLWRQTTLQGTHGSGGATGGDGGSGSGDDDDDCGSGSGGLRQMTVGDAVTDSIDVGAIDGVTGVPDLRDVREGKASGRTRATGARARFAIAVDMVKSQVKRGKRQDPNTESLREPLIAAAASYAREELRLSRTGSGQTAAPAVARVGAGDGAGAGAGVGAGDMPGARERVGRDDRDGGSAGGGAATTGEPPTDLGTGSGGRERGRKRSIKVHRGLLQRYFSLGVEGPRFTDHEPLLFLGLRALADLDTDTYVNSLRFPTRVKVSEGASGAFMYFTQDQRIVVKTCSKEELGVLLRMLPRYSTYLHGHPSSLLTRFLGAHTFELYGLDIHFVVMKNVFHSPRASKIHATYDLKGSWVNRNAPTEMKLKRNKTAWTCRHCHKQYTRAQEFERCMKRPTGYHTPGTVLKDNDLNFRLCLAPTVAEHLTEVLTQDATFLASQQIMDYSLLLGVHYCQFSRAADSSSLLGAGVGGGGMLGSSAEGSGSVTVPEIPRQWERADSRREFEERKTATPSPHPSGQPPGSSSIPASDQSPSSRHNHVFQAMRVEGAAEFHIGIIDVLQQWTTGKKAERLVKHVRGLDVEGISCVPPDIYLERFLRRVVSAVVLDRETTYPLEEACEEVGTQLGSRPSAVPGNARDAAVREGAGTGDVAVDIKSAT